MIVIQLWKIVNVKYINLSPMTLYYCTYYNIIFLFLLGVATGTSVIYGREAPELQLRKMADLYFMFKMYKQAYTHYHTSKKDFYVSRILQ